jgi:hypothetical protein
LRSPATRSDALPRQRFAEYAARHHSRWLAFANGRHARGVVAEDLLLITGCDRTSAWSVAAFTEARRGGSIFFRGGYASVAGAGLALKGTWDAFTSAEHRSGPSGSGNRNNEITQGTTANMNLEPAQSPRDQCVFVRGYKVRFRRLLGPKVIRAGAGPRREQRGSDREDTEHDVHLNHDEDIMETESIVSSEPVSFCRMRFQLIH